MKLFSILKSANRSAHRRNRLAGRTKRPSVLAFNDFSHSLEERQLLSSFSHNLNTVMIDLDNPNQVLTISATANSYKFVLSGGGIGKNGWTGTNGLGLSSTLATLTASSTAQTGFNTFQITDSAANTTVIFDDSGTNSYKNNFNIALNNLSNSVQFIGNSTFAGNNNLAILADSRAEITGGACLTMTNGDLSMDSRAAGVALFGPDGQQRYDPDDRLGQDDDRGGGRQRQLHDRFEQGRRGDQWRPHSWRHNRCPEHHRLWPFPCQRQHRLCLWCLCGGNMSEISSIGSGLVSVVGYGGGSSTTREGSGVYVAETGIITSGTNGSVAVNGTGSNISSGTYNVGVLVEGNIKAGSGTGSTTVTGTGGGCGTSSSNIGVLVQGYGYIGADGSGNVNVAGYGGGNATGNFNSGVDLEGSTYPLQISSNGGNVTVTGVGGGGLDSAASPSAASYCYGVNLYGGATITAGGNYASVTVSGQGGNRSPGATGSYNHGVNIGGFYYNNVAYVSFSKITSYSGPVHVSGIGGGGSGTTVSSNLSACNYGVYLYAGGQINTGWNGALTVNGTGGGYGSNSGNGQVGIWLDSGRTLSGYGSIDGFYPSCITTGGDGNLTINGTGGGVGSSTSNYGVEITYGAMITSGGMGLSTITGIGGNTNATSSTGDDGLYIQNAKITSGGGDIVVNGTGGGQNADSNNGVLLYMGGVITAPGTASVTVNGWGGNANGTSGRGNTGVSVSSILNGVKSAITTNNGPIVVTGHGGNTNTTITNANGLNYGVSVTIGGEISAGGSGSVTVTGTGGGLTQGATGNNDGVYVTLVSGTTLPRIGSSGGAVNVIGHGGGNNGNGTNNHGVDIQDGAMITSTGYGVPVNITGYGGGGDATSGVSDGIYMLGSDTYNTHTITANGGDITLRGTSGTGSWSLGLGQWNYRTTDIGNATTPGNITILTDTINLSTWGGSINAGKMLTIATLTHGQSVQFTGTSSSGKTSPLNLTTQGLASMHADTIQIGDSNTGNIVVGYNLNIPASNLTLVTNNAAATKLSPYNNITLGAGKTLDLSGVNSLDIRINKNSNGTAATYLPLNLTGGNLTITGVKLNLNGDYTTPVAGDMFTIAKSAHLTGTFSGLANGSTTTLYGSTLVVNYNATSATLSEPTPTVTTQPANIGVVVVGSQATFTATASVAVNIATTVQWQKKNSGGLLWNDIAGATSNTYSFNTTAADDGDQFRAVFTNAYAQTTSNAATLTVNSGASAPTITGEPANVSLEVGQTASFTATATGSPAPTVQWQKKNSGGLLWNDIYGATSTTYSFTTVAGDNGDHYRAVFTNASGMATTSAATVTIGVAPHFTSTNEMTIPVGLTSGISVIATGSPAPTYASSAGTLPTGVTLNATTGLLSGTPAAGTAGSWPITIQASNGIGTAASQSFSLKVVSSVSSFVISKGQTQRSYIRYIDLGLDSNASALALLNNPGRVQLTRAALDGNGSTNVPLTGFLPVPTGQSKLAFDFGAVGLGNSRNTTTADGYYTLGLDLDGNGSYETSLYFFRLFGDINGDSEVTSADQTAVQAAMYLPYDANLDLNGDGKVNTSDLQYIRKAVGRRVRAGLIITS